MNFDLLNTACQNAILISEDYCLDKSFDIIEKNIQRISQDLTSSSFDIEKFLILKERYIKNKNKYNKFITFTRQFSSTLASTQNTFNTYKNIWQASNTPFEIIYPEIVDISEWGTFNKNNGNISEDSNLSKKSINNISKWINDKFPEQRYGIYKKIIINVFLSTNITNKFTFKTKHKEMCDTSQNDAFVLNCTRLNVDGRRGCNRMETNRLGAPTGGHQCGNLYSFCTNPYINQKGTAGGVTGTQQARVEGSSTGFCRGWPPGMEPRSVLNPGERPFSGKMLSINSSIECPNDFYLIGYKKVTFVLNTKNVWERN
jgi:hypothetical protein